MSRRLGDLASDVVNKYGVVWVASASNHGPALSTIGSPPNFHSDCIMGIGAYVSPEMMRGEYSIMDKIPGDYGLQLLTASSIILHRDLAF